MNPLVIGIDLGTSLCKAGAFELDGNLVMFKEKKIKTYRPQPGWAEQDPNEWIVTITDLLSALTNDLGKDRKRISAIGLSAHGPSLIMTDQKIYPLGRCPIWQDQRAAYLVDELIEKAGTDWVGLGVPESSFGVQLYWSLINNKDNLKSASHLLDVKGFLLSRLTGQIVDEPSSSLVGNKRDNVLLNALDIDSAKLPNTISSTTIAGELRLDINRITGLPLNIKVVAGLNDGASASLGAGVVNLGQGIVSLSTNGVLRTVVPGRLPGNLLLKYSLFCYPYVDGMYIIGGMTKCGADSVNWYIETFLGGYEDNIFNPFDIISKDVQESPLGANGVLFMPYLMGVGTPTPKKEHQAAFVNIGRHHQRSDMTRALLEGIAFSLKDIGNTFDDLGHKWNDLRFTGGGSKNIGWRQIVSNILGKQLVGIQSDSVLGAAIIGAVGAGLFTTIREAVSAMVRPIYTVEPDPNHVVQYEKLYKQFKNVKPMLGEFLFKDV
jgi:xylulokinase